MVIAKAVAEALQPYEASLAAIMRGYFRAQEASVLARLDASGYVALGVKDRLRGRKNVAAATPFNQAEWNAKLAAKVDPWIKLVFTDAAKDTYEQGLQFDPEAHVNVGTAFDVRDTRAIQYLATKPQTFAQQVNDATWFDLKVQLMQGIDKGEPLSLLKERVRSKFQAASAHRVEAIARTETVGASNAGSLAGAMQSPAFQTKTWLAALDTRTRASHVAAHNQTVDKDQPFKVGSSEGQAPHAFTAAREVVNCRCTMIFGSTAMGLMYRLPTPPASAPAPVAPPPPPPPPPAVVTPPATVTPAPAPVATPPATVTPPAPATPPARKPRAPRKPRVPKVTIGAGFPDDVDALEVVKPLPGSTGAELVRDPATGSLYVRKRGANEAHLREEMTADAVYRALGTNVPEFQQYRDRNGRLVKLSRFVEGATSLGDLAPAARAKAIKELQQGFAVDALLGNWDVIGLGEDNVLIGKDGTVYRIDNGGAMRFRAQGQPKDDAAFNAGVVDLWGMRNRDLNGSAAKVFGALGPADIAKQARAVVAKWNGTDMQAVFGALQQDDALYNLLAKRVDNLGRYARQAETLLADKYKPEYTERFTRSYQQLMQGGLAESLPKALAPNTSVNTDVRYVYDAAGKLFDSYRDANTPNGGKSPLAIMQEVMKAQGGDYDDVMTWAGEQGSDSWMRAPITVKGWYSAQRTAAYDQYFRKRGSGGQVTMADGTVATNHYDVLQGVKTALANGQFPGARRKGNRVTRTASMTAEQYGKAVEDAALESFETTFAIQNAFTYAMLETTRITARRDTFGGDPYTVRLIRTEPDNAVTAIAKNEVKVIKRGGMESTSAITGIVVSGDNLTMTDVPIHRVMGTYYQGRNLAGRGEYDMFLGVGENEFVAHLEGLPTRYIGHLGRSGSSYGAIRDRLLTPRTLNDIPDNVL